MSFNNWPIRLKLSGGFGTLIFICAMIGLMSITTISRLAEMISEMHDNNLQQVVSLTEIHDMVLDHNLDDPIAVLDPIHVIVEVSRPDALGVLRNHERRRFRL